MVNNLNWEDTASNKPYSVNFEETEKYLGKLKSSGFISNIYLQKWRKYFKEKGNNLRKNAQYDSPPDGFEFDFVLWTQIIDETLKSIDYYEFIEINELNTHSNVKINIGMKLSFSLTKHADKWLIDDIDNLGM
jgi:hypothetical protein